MRRVCCRNRWMETEVWCEDGNRCRQDRKWMFWGMSCKQRALVLWEKCSAAALSLNCYERIYLAICSAQWHRSMLWRTACCRVYFFFRSSKGKKKMVWWITSGAASVQLDQYIKKKTKKGGKILLKQLYNYTEDEAVQLKHCSLVFIATVTLVNIKTKTWIWLLEVKLKSFRANSHLCFLWSIIQIALLVIWFQQTWILFKCVLEKTWYKSSIHAQTCSLVIKHVCRSSTSLCILCQHKVTMVHCLPAN